MTGIAERVGARWKTLLWLVPTAIVALAIVVLLARSLRDVPAVQSFLTDYPGYSPLPDTAPVGIPAWLGWQHFLNAFFLVTLVRSGWLLRTHPKPPATWTRNNTGRIRTAGNPRRISIYLWLHLGVDALWVLNGVVFVVLLVVTGHWMRIVPLGWDIVPNAISTGLQYASLQWPTASGWANYNALQVLSYFVTVFVAAPLALVTGLRMSPAWSPQWRISRVFRVRCARAVHFPVMVYFVAFTVVHVTLVFATGALRNLNHMYAARDAEGWLGFWIFAASLAAMVAAWVLVRPAVLAPITALSGKVGR